MKIVCYVLLLVMISIPCHAEFRGLKWGAKQSQVKARMSIKPTYAAKDYLSYKETLLGIEVSTLFGFENNKLVRGGYITKALHVKNLEHLADHYTIKESLINKYGKPTNDTEPFFEEHFADIEKLFKAIQNKEITFFSRWELKDKTIKLIFTTNDSMRFTTIVLFQQLGDAERQAKKEESML